MATRHFVLVHGACLGGWTWYKVAAKLKSAGHKVTALDMAASGINPEQVKDVHSIQDYSKPLMEFMETLLLSDERVILVAHSHGGECVSLAMEKYPHKISVAVFVSAFMPCLGFDMDKIFEKYKRPREFYMDCKYEYREDGQLISTLFGPDYMSTRLLTLCPPEDLELALVLIRPIPASATLGALEKDSKELTEENFGSVRRVYIKLEDDDLISRPVERFRLENYPPEEVVIVHNADHMAMLSNPQDLSSSFLQISQKYV